jgi:hypothetical protein
MGRVNAVNPIVIFRFAFTTKISFFGTFLLLIEFGAGATLVVRRIWSSGSNLVVAANVRGGLRQNCPHLLFTIFHIIHENLLLLPSFCIQTCLIRKTHIILTYC